jgi:hypothetical protein
MPTVHTKRPTARMRRQVVVVRTYAGKRPTLLQLEQKNRKLEQTIRDLDLRLQLASNNPGSALYPTIRDYLALAEQYTLLEDQFNAADELQRPAIEQQMNEMRPDLLRAMDAMTDAMHKYIRRRIARQAPRVPMMTVEA